MPDSRALDINLPSARTESKNAYSLFENAPGFIATTCGPAHHFIFANHSYKRFVQRQQLVGLTVAEALPDVVDQGIIELLDQVFRTGEPFIGKSLPVKVRDPLDGKVQIRYCDCIYQAIRGADDEVIGIFCEGYDVTERHETADELLVLQSQLIHAARVNEAGIMATMLAHELNQPLAAIMSYASGMMKTVEAGPQSDRLVYGLKGIEEASKRAADVLRSLRHLTRPREFFRTEFPLDLVAEECIRLVHPTVSPNITIANRIAKGTMMSADRIQIQQVLINLLRNACDAVKDSDQQHIKIAAKEVEESLVVSVTDTGRGVPAEMAHCLFSWSPTTKDEGMGLGLSICRRIIEGNLGRIWLENSSCQGSEFCFSIPLSPGTADKGS